MELIRVEHSDKKYKQWVRIEWNMGRRCNFDCSYCGADLHDNKSKHLPFEKFDDAVRTMREFYADKQIRMSLTGGEPFVHPRILDILKLFPKYGVDEVSTITNGSLPLAKYQRALESIDNLIFSWHFEFVRQDHMKHVLGNLNRKQVKVHLMYLPGHLEEIKNAVDWLQDNNVKFNVRRIRPMTNVQTGEMNQPYSSGMEFAGVQYAAAENYYSQEELDYLKTFHKAGTAESNCELFTEEQQWLDNVNTLTKNKWNTFKRWRCMAGIETLMIDNDGSVYRATCKQGGVLGNLETGFTLKEDPVICMKQWCNCAADLNTTKWADRV
jgi:MoaA/NifB/PqqE/SkfB family radical SAM enzyme